jgi:uncharacterized membrane protein
VEDQLLTHIRQAHAFFRTTATYPLALTSSAAVLMILLRMIVTDSATYVFLIWNLILAWIPFVCGLAVFKLAPDPRNRWIVVPLAALWVLFLPNAPYLLTDMIHLRHSTQVGWWYDLVLLLLCAWSGLMLGVVSLQHLQLRVARAAGPWVGWLFVGTMIGLGSLGVAIGRLLRWNSWDLLLDPGAVLRDVLATMAETHLDRAMLGLSGGIAILWLLVYCSVRASVRISAESLQTSPAARHP